MLGFCCCVENTTIENLVEVNIVGVLSDPGRPGGGIPAKKTDEGVREQGQILSIASLVDEQIGWEQHKIEIKQDGSKKKQNEARKGGGRFVAMASLGKEQYWREEYWIEVRKEGPFGLKLDKDTVTVSGVVDGCIKRYNELAPEHLRVAKGDQVVCVNGVGGCADDILERIRKTEDGANVVLKLARGRY